MGAPTRKLDNIMHTRTLRICADHGTEFLVFNEAGGLEKAHAAGSDPERPAVGDWVDVNPEQRICSIHRRSNLIARQKSSGETQALAANVDQVWLVMPLDREPSHARWERFTLFSQSQGIKPAMILTKLDLCLNPDPWVSMAVSLGFGDELHTVSAVAGTGLEALAAKAADGQTVLLLGQSGAGKTSLVNALCPSQHAVREVREHDARGRHTTTSRRLIKTHRAGFLLDIPGIRELSWLGQDMLPTAFLPMADQCKFKNCRHEGEMGCAVEQAAREGSISMESLHHWKKLQREASYHARRDNPRLNGNSKARWKDIHKRKRLFQKLREDE